VEEHRRAWEMGRGDFGGFFGEQVEQMARMAPGLQIQGSSFPVGFVLARKVLRHEAEALGLVVLDEDIVEVMKELPMRGDDLRSYYRRTPFSQSDLMGLVEDMVLLDKLAATVAGELPVAESIAKRAYSSGRQRVSGRYLWLEQDEEMLSGIEVSEEEVEGAFAEVGAGLMHDERRGLWVVHLPRPDGLDELGDEARDAAILEFNRGVQAFSRAVVQRGSDFKAEAEKAGHEVVELDAFGRRAAPEGWEGKNDLIAGAFDPALGEGDVGRLADDGAGGYYVFRVVEVIAPEPKDLDDAREELVALLKERRASAALLERVEAARAAVVAGLGEGKPVEELVGGIEGEEFRVYENWSRMEFPTLGDGFGALILWQRGLWEVPAGEVSEIFRDGRPDPMGGGGALFGEAAEIVSGAGFALVERKELWKSPDDLLEQAEVGQRLGGAQSMVRFQSWFEDKVRASDYKIGDVLIQQTMGG